MWYPDQGVGFPSTSQELVQRPRNTADPSGYYSDLDLPPWASEREIARRCRWLMSRFHPDGPAPNPELYAHIAMISKVLRNPVERVKYERTPPGKVYIDEEVVAQFRADGKEDLLVAEPPVVKPGRPLAWTYMSDRPNDPRDPDLAARWYQLLLDAAHELGWVSRIQLHLTVAQVNGVVGEEVYVWKHAPSVERARAVLKENACRTHQVV